MRDHPRAADNDPVYSPEVSDEDPRGDWQTNLAFSVFATLATLGMMAGVWYVFWKF